MSTLRPAPAPRVLALPFLGARTYLQGTTLLDALLPDVPAGAELTMRFGRLLTTDRVRVDHGEGDGGPPYAVLTHSAGAHRLEVRPLEPSPDIARVPYDEEALWARARFGAGEVALDAPSPHGFVASAVSLLKALLTREHPVARPGRWLFTGMDLPRVPEPWWPLTVARESLVAGRMARAGLHVAGAPAGRIYFAWADPPA